MGDGAMLILEAKDMAADKMSNGDKHSQKKHKDKNVESAQIFQRHPVLDKPLIYVKMRSGKPETAIKKAVKTLSANFEKALGILEKELE